MLTWHNRRSILKLYPIYHAFGGVQLALFLSFRFTQQDSITKLKLIVSSITQSLPTLPL